MSGFTSIIILTYNQLHLTRVCLGSINTYTKKPFELIFVDNGSTDGTVDYLQRIREAKLILNKENLGFSKGVNQGLELARGEEILLLNNDTIPSHNWLSNLQKCLYSRPEIGIVGPRSNYAGGRQGGIAGDFSTINQIHSFSKEFNIPNPCKWHEVELITGFCMLIKKRLIDQLGLFDERFKYGMFEDCDYCKRALNHGYKLYCAGDTFIYHVGSRSFHQNNLNMAEIFYHNKRLFEEKWCNGSVGK
ncbi:glycosyltransferase [Iocasia frigidifontis]|uniref:Glycosyltransferase n=1 Tax=Iocasia fonsfrigidae TaxID=2682810 RepID=A0A8A7KD22_9FIRM|nr:MULTISPECIES: glycosyltransferase family 2 protein [Halanaerobiaceae]AZO93846.1 glycosyltransferase family 2 protein [Halocella sp. SP3-1]QTL96787.1 glycosyltransferase [Iocasia fonsfrigidae]